MTRPSPVLLRPLRLSPAGRWLPSSRPLNLDRHPPPPKHRRDPDTRFDTLATDTTAAASLQSVPSAAAHAGGSRTATPLASAAPAPPPPPARTKRRVLGIELPAKPDPPAADECCMSGCATCVYDIFLEDLEHFHSSVSAARSAVLDRLRAGARLDNGAWPAEVLGPWEDAEKELRGVRDGASGEERETAAREQAERELRRTRDALDPSMRAFLEMEARMKAKQREKTAPLSPAPGSNSLSSSPP
ncbi:hypothetical protein JCM3770_001319 [Rhodotorula araucariae]